MLKAGFYKVVEDKLVHAPNAVHHKDYTLLKENKNNYRFPSYGWYWFDTREEALDFFGIEEEIVIDERKSYSGKEVQEILDQLNQKHEKERLEWGRRE